MSKEQEKQDNENYSKNFTRIPNIVFASYKHLSHEEKHLYNDLKYVYWDAKPRFASLREISRLTGYAISALSRILPRLHKCGLIHAEIKQEYNPDGTKKGKPKYHITIIDIWELNRKYFECSPEERFDPSDVLLENDNVLQKNVNVLDENVFVPSEEHLRSSQEHKSSAKASPQARSQPAKDSNKITKDSKKESADTPNVIDPQDDSSLPSFTPSSSLVVSSQLSTAEVQNCIPSAPNPSVHIDTEATHESTLTDAENEESVTTRNTSSQVNTPSSEGAPKDTELDPEQKRIAGYLRKLKFPFPRNKENLDFLTIIAEFITSLEEMDSYIKFTQKQFDGPVFLGNLANMNNMNRWIQAEKRKKPKEEEKRDRPKTLQEMTLKERNAYYRQMYGETPQVSATGRN